MGVHKSEMRTGDWNFSKEFWENLNKDTFINQGKPTVAVQNHTAPTAIVITNTDEWVAYWRELVDYVEKASQEAGSIYISFDEHGYWTVASAKPTLADLQLEDKTSDIQPS